MPGTVNSNYEEIKPISSAEGDSLFFLRSYSPYNKGGEGSEEDIWLSIFNDETGWSEAVNTFGYRNHPGPDIFVGWSRNSNSFFALDYINSGQNRSIIIIQYQIQKPDKLDKISESFTSIEIGNGYHDVHINPEGTVLLISMNTLNSYGLEDIYISLKNKRGIWSDPKNLGPNINSRGFEISPFLSDNSKILYFASDGYNGLGDADIYYSHRLDSGWQNWSEPVNMGPPVNSRFFDAYLSVNKRNEIFFVSNRKGQYSDIFKATLSEYVNLDAQKKKEDIVDYLALKDAAGDEKMEEKYPGASLYFEFDDFKLKKEELEKLDIFAEKIMNSAQSDLEIYGYTDDAGSQSYNYRLSEKRAKFVYKYLKKFGIDDDRLYMEGKGILITSNEYEIPPSEKRKVEILVKSNSR